MNKGSYLHTCAVSTITQIPLFSQGLSAQKLGTSVSGFSVRVTEGVVVVVGLVVVEVGLMVLALDVFITKVGETLG